MKMQDKTIGKQLGAQTAQTNAYGAEQSHKRYLPSTCSANFAVLVER